MCCPNCESDYLEHWIVVDETDVHTDYNGKDWLHIVRGCKCNECGHTWSNTIQAQQPIFIGLTIERIK
jgi:uncharacterized Zn finger protein